MSNLKTIEPAMAYDLIPTDKQGNPKYTTLSEFNTIVNSTPRNSWVKKNKYAQNAKYLPIGIVEDLLSSLFPFWQVEQVGNAQILGNSVVISVALKVYHPLINQWLTYAGIGAVPIEVEKGAHPTDFTKINSKAMHKNVPAALSFAVNNASKKIGKLFGSHLNRGNDEQL
jgi:hypothetical protein